MPENDHQAESTQGRRTLPAYYNFFAKYQPVANADLDVPEKMLWAYCLVQAFTTQNTEVFQRSASYFPEKGSVRVDCNDNERLHSDSREVGSYLFICEVLDLDPESTLKAGKLLNTVHKFRKKAGRKPKKLVTEDLSNLNTEKL